MLKEGERAKSLSDLQIKLGYSFNDSGLLVEALTHSSYANESGLPFNNERLEFLGDAVLELIASQGLYQRYPNMNEGELTRLRSRYVCEKSLYAWALEIGLLKLIKVGKSLAKSGATPAMAADAVESLFGAVFLDGGYSGASFVVNKFLDSQKKMESLYTIDPKTKLQELIQGEGRGVPYYRTVERSAPDQAACFKVQVTLGETVLAEARGANIKEAEFKAAEQALKNMPRQCEYVCYCAKVTETDIIAAIRAGADSVEAVIKATGAMENSDCAVNNPKGVCCYPDIAKVFENNRNG